MTIEVYYLDDEKKLCELFSEFLTSDQIKITTFVDADDAIAAVKANPPDLFFIDFRLPGTTGDEVALAIADSIPKILVTGDLYFKPEYKFQHIISKPFEFDEIQKLIDEYHASK